MAVPVSWDELTPALDPAQFTVRTVPERLATMSADPWASFFKLKQTLGDAARRLLASASP